MTPFLNGAFIGGMTLIANGVLPRVKPGGSLTPKGLRTLVLLALPMVAVYGALRFGGVADPPATAVMLLAAVVEAYCVRVIL